MDIILTFLAVTLSISFYILIRNEWVCKIVIEAIHNHTIDQIPNYKLILFRYFWVWNKKKLYRTDWGKKSQSAYFKRMGIE